MADDHRDDRRRVFERLGRNMLEAGAKIPIAYTNGSVMHSFRNNLVESRGNGNLLNGKFLLALRRTYSLDIQIFGRLRLCRFDVMAGIHRVADNRSAGIHRRIRVIEHKEDGGIHNLEDSRVHIRGRGWGDHSLFYIAQLRRKHETG